MTSFCVAIPARYQSTRFPGKPLVEIHGKPMVQHVYERAVASGATRVVVATDDQRIAQVVRAFGGEVCMTRAHPSGTDRLAEVVQQLNLSDDTILVNVQGDEPMIPPLNIAQVAHNLAQHTDASIATLVVPIEDAEERDNPNIVKVVFNQQGYALYFSRAAIPYVRDQQDVAQAKYYRHIGIYAYRAAYLGRYTAQPPAPMEQAECLEQLRALYLGDRIHVAIAQQTPPPGIDTPEDLVKLLQAITS
ncbi:MAG: 3-deoxy-manno-octulosonate cytidylyltransferase [Gammaproteobacteria bacterium]|nr:3-deoxy-manno-octulosonate cytidylyltransferase [Gammaproteobacteria bacterium]